MKQRFLPYQEEQQIIANSIGIDNGVSYSPVDIERWCKLKIKSHYTTTREKDEIIDMLCEYFIASPMRPSPKNKYFIKRRKPTGELILVKDRNAVSKSYRVMTPGQTGCIIELSQGEKNKFEMLSMKLGIPIQFNELG